MRQPLIWIAVALMLSGAVLHGWTDAGGPHPLSTRRLRSLSSAWLRYASTSPYGIRRNQVGELMARVLMTSRVRPGVSSFR